LERPGWRPRSRSEVFACSAGPDHLTRVTPPSVGFLWLTPPPLALTAGAVLEFSTRMLGVPLRWRVFVREFDPPYRFVDAQLWGPFARWEHRHRFLEGPRDDAVGGPVGTWMEDRVTYRLPLGPLGRLAHACGVGRTITGIFDLR